MQTFLLIQYDQLAVFVSFLEHMLTFLYVAVIVLQSQQWCHQGHIGLSVRRSNLRESETVYYEPKEACIQNQEKEDTYYKSKYLFKNKSSHVVGLCTYVLLLAKSQFVSLSIPFFYFKKIKQGKTIIFQGIYSPPKKYHAGTFLHIQICISNNQTTNSTGPFSCLVRDSRIKSNLPFWQTTETK